MARPRILFVIFTVILQLLTLFSDGIPTFKQPTRPYRRSTLARKITEPFRALRRLSATLPTRRSQHRRRLSPNVAPQDPNSLISSSGIGSIASNTNPLPSGNNINNNNNNNNNNNFNADFVGSSSSSGGAVISQGPPSLGSSVRSNGVGTINGEGNNNAVNGRGANRDRLSNIRGRVARGGNLNNMNNGREPSGNTPPSSRHTRRGIESVAGGTFASGRGRRSYRRSAGGSMQQNSRNSENNFVSDFNSNNNLLESSLPLGFEEEDLRGRRRRRLLQQRHRRRRLQQIPVSTRNVGSSRVPPSISSSRDVTTATIIDDGELSSSRSAIRGTEMSGASQSRVRATGPRLPEGIESSLPAPPDGLTSARSASVSDPSASLMLRVGSSSGDDDQDAVGSHSDQSGDGGDGPGAVGMSDSFIAIRDGLPLQPSVWYLLGTVAAPDFDEGFDEFDEAGVWRPPIVAGRQQSPLPPQHEFTSTSEPLGHRAYLTISRLNGTEALLDEDDYDECYLGVSGDSQPVVPPSGSVASSDDGSDSTAATTNSLNNNNKKNNNSNNNINNKRKVSGRESSCLHLRLDLYAVNIVTLDIVVFPSGEALVENIISTDSPGNKELMLAENEVTEILEVMRAITLNSFAPDDNSEMKDDGSLNNNIHNNINDDVDDEAGAGVTKKAAKAPEISIHSVWGVAVFRQAPKYTPLTAAVLELSRHPTYWLMESISAVTAAADDSTESLAAEIARLEDPISTIVHPEVGVWLSAEGISDSTRQTPLDNASSGGGSSGDGNMGKAIWPESPWSRVAFPMTIELQSLYDLMPMVDVSNGQVTGSDEVEMSSVVMPSGVEAEDFKINDKKTDNELSEEDVPKLLGGMLRSLENFTIDPTNVPWVISMKGRSGAHRVVAVFAKTHLGDF